MYAKSFDPVLMNDAIEREMIIRELRAQASAELAHAIGRLLLKGVKQVRKVFEEVNKLRAVVPPHLRQMS